MPLAASMAKARASDAATSVTHNAIQTFGGIGFTWEHDLHRLYKRARGIDSFGGSATRLRAEVASYLLDGPASDEPAVAPTPVAIEQGG